MEILEEQANAQIRWIMLAQGGGSGIYATDDIWHGQEVMLDNQEQTTDSEENSRPRLVDESELCHEWDGEGNPQSQGRVQLWYSTDRHNGTTIVIEINNNQYRE
jgi:hypothetical protein